MEALLASFAPYGFAAVVCAVLFWMVFKLQDKLTEMTKAMFEVVENNTKAQAELKATVEKCQYAHRGSD